MGMEPIALSSLPQLPAPGERRRRLQGAALVSVLASLLLTLFLGALDQTVVGTALPKIIGSLQGFDRYTWAVNAYILASVTMIPTVGKLSDQFGCKWFLIGGTALFLLGSAFSGASQTMNQFIAFRALQGLGAGVGMLVFVAVADIFPPEERARWQGLFGSVYGVASLLRPTLGGWLTDHGPLVGTLVTETTRWRWIFYINVPVGIIVLSTLMIYLPANISVRSNHYTSRAAVRRIDFLGAVLGAVATICLLLGLAWGSNTTYQWSSPQVIGILVAAALLFGAFLVAERKASEPILPLDLLRNRVFTIAALLSLLQLMVLGGLVVYLPLFFQGVLAVSATSAGAVLTPLSLSSVIGAVLTGFVLSVFNRPRVITLVSALIMTVGVFLLTQMTPTTSLLEAIIFMVIAGIGLGPFYSVPTVAAQNALPRELLGISTSTLRYLGQLGLVLGVAIVGTVVNNTLTNTMAPRLASIPDIGLFSASVLKRATDPQVLLNDTSRQNLIHSVLQHTPPRFQQNVPHLFNQVFDALKDSLAVAIVAGFAVALVMCVITVFTSLLLKYQSSQEMF